MSCTLGMSYRSDAAPLEAPSTPPSTDSASGSGLAPTTPSVPVSPAPSTSQPASGSGDGDDDDDANRAAPTISVDTDAFRPGSVTVVVVASGGATETVTTISGEHSGTSLPSCSSSRCTFSGLSGDVWNIRATQSWTGDDARSSDPAAVSVTVPSAPTISVGGQSGFQLGGTGGRDGDVVRVSLSSGTPICDATVVEGAWSCSDLAAPSEAGQYRYHAFEESAPGGAESLFSDSVSYDVTPAPTPSETATDTPAPEVTPSAETTSPAPSPRPTSGTRKISLPTLATWSFSVFGIDLGDVHPGDHFTVTGTQLPPGATVSGELHSVAVPVGSTRVAADGTFTLPVTVPADFSPGTHELVMTL
jgi:hypothetical protein